MFIAWSIVNCLVALVGLFLLGRYRHRAPRGTRLGIVAMLCYGLAVAVMLALAVDTRFLALSSVWFDAVRLLMIFLHTASVLLLVVAVVIDRR